MTIVLYYYIVKNTRVSREARDFSDGWLRAVVVTISRATRTKTLVRAYLHRRIREEPNLRPFVNQLTKFRFGASKRKHVSVCLNRTILRLVTVSQRRLWDPNRTTHPPDPPIHSDNAQIVKAYIALQTLNVKVLKSVRGLRLVALQ